MSKLLTIIRILAGDERRAILIGFSLSLTVLAMGAGLLGVAGWFVTASAAAGLAGAGILFNFFVPSAMVRLLALGRTVTRYGERVFTHDATLRALSGLRVRLLRGLLDRPHAVLDRMRASWMLGRVTSDIDALDGALLRLAIPALAGWGVIVCAAVALWFIVHPAVSVAVGLGYLIVPTLIFILGQRAAGLPSRRAEIALQSGQARFVDMIAGRDDLAMFGQLDNAQSDVAAAFTRQSVARLEVERIERRIKAALDLAVSGITAAALAIGVTLVQSGVISAPYATVGVLVSLALAEAVAPVRRAAVEIARMAQAAKRILPALGSAEGKSVPEDIVSPRHLKIDSVCFKRGPDASDLFRPITFAVAPGETVALTGPSGVGKSTVLLIAAGALEASAGQVLWGSSPVDECPESMLRKNFALVPQHSALVSGTIADNLRLADPTATDAELWQALETVKLSSTIRAKGGLSAKLGFRGSGLSGGEARRFVLARAILCRPALLLLDEPTEGIDDETAQHVLAGIRDALPEAAILMASHREVELTFASSQVELIGSMAPGD